MAQINFDPKKHEYTTESGERVLSVTQVLDVYNVYNGIRKETLEVAAERGTAVHQSIETLLNYGIADINEEYTPYIKAFEDFYKRYSPRVIATEKLLYNHYEGYAGTTDLICEFGGERILIDYKTCSTINEKLIRLQLEAYARAYTAEGGYIHGKAILHLKPNGKFKLYRYNGLSDVDWEMFKHTLAVAKYKEEMKKGR